MAALPNPSVLVTLALVDRQQGTHYPSLNQNFTWSGDIFKWLEWLLSGSLVECRLAAPNNRADI